MLRPKVRAFHNFMISQFERTGPCTEPTDINLNFADATNKKLGLNTQTFFRNFFNIIALKAQFDVFKFNTILLI